MPAHRSTLSRAIAAALIVTASASARSADDPPDPIQGNWLGDWTPDKGGGGKQTAQIVALGKGMYQGAFTAYDGGESQSETFRFVISGTLTDSGVVFEQKINLGETLGTFEWGATAKDGLLKGRYSNNRNYIGTFTLKRVELKPEQVGTEPLPGAVVLFDGTGLDRWTRHGGGSTAWKLVDGALQVGRNAGRSQPEHLVCRETFRDAQIHLEYRTPFLPEARGLERGASGVFVQGRYEIQVLDSFGQPRVRDNFGALADDDSAGAVFKRAAPLENVALPPREWQALDITFTAPELKPDGAVQRPGTLTVVHNGTVIHNALKLEEPTSGAPIQDLTTPAGLILEDAGQPVEFRNIWMVRLDQAP